MTSRDGRRWSEPQPLVNIAKDDYQISWPTGKGRLGTAFDHHPPPLGLNARANIYYLETNDGRATWTTAAGDKVVIPLNESQNLALVLDSVSEGKLVYLKDLTFDSQGHPVILFCLVTSICGLILAQVISQANDTTQLGSFQTL